DSLDNHSLILLFFFWEIQVLGKGNVAGDNGFMSIGTYPEDRLVVLPMPMRVFHSYLRFPDSTQPADGLRLRKCGWLERVSQLCQQGFLSRKERIRWIWDVPETGKCRRMGSKRETLYFLQCGPDALGDIFECFILVIPLTNRFITCW